jgi:hypothetical protein
MNDGSGRCKKYKKQMVVVGMECEGEMRKRRSDCRRNFLKEKGIIVGQKWKGKAVDGRGG